MIKLVRCPEIVTEQGDQCIRIAGHVGPHEINLDFRPKPVLKHCLWCANDEQINDAGACIACGEIARRAAEASRFLDWVVKGGLIIAIACVIGALIQTIR